MPQRQTTPEQYCAIDETRSVVVVCIHITKIERTPEFLTGCDEGLLHTATAAQNLSNLPQPER